MSLFRLTQHIEKEDNYRIEIAFEDDGSRQTPEARFEFQDDQVTARICAGIWRIICNIRWTPRRKSRHGWKGGFGNLGMELFEKIFQANDDTRDLWATLRR